MKISGIDSAAVFAPWKSAEIPRRIWAKEAALWKEDSQGQASISNRLGWLDLPRAMTLETAGINSFVAEIKKAGFTDAVLLGMGGSSLCPEVLRRTFGVKKGFLRLHVLDTTDPGAILDVEKKIRLPKTLFIVSSKSGGTIEVVSLFNYFHEKIRKLKKVRAGENFVAVTDPGTGLQKLAAEKKFRRIFLAPADVGGRYSALSFFGLVPAALLGVNVDELLSRARAAAEASSAEKSLEDNPAAGLGIILGTLGKAGRDKATFFISPEIESLGLWVEQLIAESTGKESRGLVPIDGEDALPLGAYGPDRVFVYIRLLKTKGKRLDAKVKSLEKSGRPVITLELKDIYDIAREFFRWEMAVAVSGIPLRVNPFDEPNVAESKANTNRILAEYHAAGDLPEDAPLLVEKNVRLWADEGISVVPKSLADGVSSHLNRLRKGDYAAFMAYLNPTPACRTGLQNLRRKMGAAGITTTLGYGPRFLHSTGQLHKGGDDNGLFIQIVSDDKKDMPIPEAGYGFSTLKRAQALGDFQSLKAHGRRVIRLQLTARVTEDLKNILGILKKFSSRSTNH